MTWVSLRYKHELRAPGHAADARRERESGLDRNTVLYPRSGPCDSLCRRFLTQRNSVFRQSDAPDHYGTKSAQLAELLCLGMDCFKSAFTRRNSHLLQIQDAADRTKTNRSCEVLAIHSGLQGAVISHTLASAWGMREKVLGWS